MVTTRHEQCKQRFSHWNAGKECCAGVQTSLLKRHCTYFLSLFVSILDILMLLGMARTVIAIWNKVILLRQSLIWGFPKLKKEFNFRWYKNHIVIYIILSQDYSTINKLNENKILERKNQKKRSHMVFLPFCYQQ